LKRRLKAGSLADIADIADIDISAFSGQLRDTTVVEFAAIGGRISAFVISASGFDAVSEFADEQEIRREVAQLLFQIKTGRFIDRLSPANQAAATERLERHSRRVYDLLLRPLGPALEADRLVFAPAGFLHYLPFHALSDGAATLLERSEVSYTPSVSLLDRCLKMPPADIRQALLVGVINELTPHVASEIERLSGFFADPITLVGSDATLANISGSSGETGLVHLACHGKFRPDSPGFSSLVLFDEEMSVNDVHQLRFQNSIIVLSACESGLNKVVRGEELIGLTQAFFASGASSLVMSLWRVNDTATLELMTEFYRHLSDRKGIAGALRLAQLHLLEKQKHPYFWAPFRVSGRW